MNGEKTNYQSAEFWLHSVSSENKNKNLLTYILKEIIIPMSTLKNEQIERKKNKVN